MPRFYFHIVSTNSFIDDEGIDLKDDQEAMQHAREMASELIKGMGSINGAVVIENEADGHMYEVPLSLWHN